MRNKNRNDLTHWNIPVTRCLDEALEKAVKVNAHISKSDFVRDAVRHLLKEIGITENNNGGNG